MAFSAAEDAPTSPGRRGGRLVAPTALSMAAFAVSVVVLAVVVLAAKLVGGWLIGPADRAEQAALFMDRWRRFLQPEPAERTMYLAAVAAAVPAAIIGIFAVRGLAARGRLASGLLLVSSLLAALLLALPFVASDFLPLIFSGGPSGAAGLLERLPQGLTYLAVLAAAVGLAVLLSPPHRPLQPLRVPASTWINAGLLLAALLFGLSTRIRSVEIGSDIHFNAVFYAVTQVFAGKTINSDLPAQYGMYPELLYPLFRLVGLSVLKFTVLMAILQTLGLLALLGVCMRLVRNDWVRAAAFLTLCMLVGSNWMSLGQSPVTREYFQVWPIRFLFPAISLLVFVHLWQRSLGPGRAALLGALAGLAVVWNLDSGIPVLGALVACLLARAVFGPAEARRANARDLLLAVAAPVCVIAAFAAYLTIKAGGDIDWSQSVKYQRIFYSSGFGMLPMPLTPHPWMVIAGLYLYGLVTGILAHVRGRPSLSSDTILYLSVMGIGLFTYYQGRSHPVVLGFVLWPSVMVAFILADRTLRAVRAAALPRWSAIAVFPILVFGALMSSLTIISAPHFIDTAAETPERIAVAATGAFGRNTAFIRERVRDGDTVAILDPAQSVYFGELGLRSAVGGPGSAELLLKQDLNQQIRELLARPVDHVFVRADASRRLVPEYRPILTKYRQAASSGKGLEYLVPREGFAAKASGG